VWKKRLREDPTVKFLEVQLTEAAPKAAGDSRVEIRLQNGRTSHRPANFECQSNFPVCRPFVHNVQFRVV